LPTIANDKMTKTEEYPTWICEECGIKHGRWFPKDGTYIGPSPLCATYHVDRCDMCNKDGVMVTEPRDFGYLKRDSLLEYTENLAHFRYANNVGKKSRKIGK
jgi:hypothetical protein